MSDSPDRAAVVAGLGRVLRLAVSVVVVLAIVAVALGIALSVFDPLLFQAVSDSPSNAFAGQPRVFESTTTSVGCAPNATDNASVRVTRLLGERTLAITGNVALPDAADALSAPTISTIAGHRYAFSVRYHATRSPPRDCPGLARYTAKVVLPYGANGFHLAVRHGGNRTLYVTDHS